MTQAHDCYPSPQRIGLAQRLRRTSRIWQPEWQWSSVIIGISFHDRACPRLRRGFYQASDGSHGSPATLGRPTGGAVGSNHRQSTGQRGRSGLSGRGLPSVSHPPIVIVSLGARETAGPFSRPVTESSGVTRTWPDSVVQVDTTV